MLKIILVIILLVIVIYIYNIIFNKSENYINITNPFVSGLSQAQLGSIRPDNSQYLDDNISEIMTNDNLINNNLINNNLINDNLTNYDFIDNDSIRINQNINLVNSLMRKKNINSKKNVKFDENIPIKKNKLINKKNTKKSINTCKLNKFFLETQFNDAYRDVMTAFNFICPDQKNLFNLQALPVTSTIYDPNKKPPLQVIKLINQFIKQLNKSILKLPDGAEILNTYNNYLPLTSQLKKYTEDKGINQFYKDIGVDFNLYADTPSNSPVELIKIISISRQYTEAETKYIISFVLKKILPSVTDQIKITVHFLYKNDLFEVDNLFGKNIQNNNNFQKIGIEFIFIDGFYTNDFTADYECYETNTDKNKCNTDGADDFYSFNALNENNLMSEHDIITELNKKLREHELEMNNFNVNIPYPVYENSNYAKN
jgi:hypothetical protein